MIISAQKQHGNGFAISRRALGSKAKHVPYNAGSTVLTAIRTSNHRTKEGQGRASLHGGHFES